MENDDVTLEFEEDEGAAGLKKLREKLKSCQKEKDEYLAGWQRAKADLINANRRATEDVARARARAHEEIAEDLMPILDSFSMARANKEAWEKVDQGWRNGIDYISTSLEKTLREYGLEEMEVKPGDPFDAERHHSVEMVETDDEKKDETIARVVQKGYTFEGSVLRAASVAVYKFEA